MSLSTNEPHTSVATCNNIEFTFAWQHSELSTDELQADYNWCEKLDLDSVDPKHRSTFTFVREPLSRLISGYAEIERTYKGREYSFLRREPPGLPGFCFFFFSFFLTYEIMEWMLLVAVSTCFSPGWCLPVRHKSQGQGLYEPLLSRWRALQWPCALSVPIFFGLIRVSRDPRCLHPDQL